MATKRLVNIIGVSIAILGIVFPTMGNTQTGSGVVRVIENDLPSVEVISTGIGYPPEKNVSEAQKRLLAQRAATVNAYRGLASTLDNISGYIINGTGSVRISGYVRGAEIIQIREYIDGKVEVDVSFPAVVKGEITGRKADWNEAISNINRNGHPVFYIKPAKREISEKEWMELVNK